MEMAAHKGIFNLKDVHGRESVKGGVQCTEPTLPSEDMSNNGRVEGQSLVHE